MLAACLQFDASVDRAGERLGVYAFLRPPRTRATATRSRCGRYKHVATGAGSRRASSARRSWRSSRQHGASSCARRELADWNWALERILRYRPHTLGEQGRAAAGHAGRDERGVEPDLPPAQRRRPEVVGMVKNEKGEQVELGHSSFSRVPALARRARCARKRSTSITRSTRPTRTRWPRR